MENQNRVQVLKIALVYMLTVFALDGLPRGFADQGGGQGSGKILDITRGRVSFEVRSPMRKVELPTKSVPLESGDQVTIWYRIEVRRSPRTQEAGQKGEKSRFPRQIMDDRAFYNA